MFLLLLIGYILMLSLGKSQDASSECLQIILYELESIIISRPSKRAWVRGYFFMARHVFCFDIRFIGYACIALLARLTHIYVYCTVYHHYADAVLGTLNRQPCMQTCFHNNYSNI